MWPVYASLYDVNIYLSFKFCPRVSARYITDGVTVMNFILTHQLFEKDLVILMLLKGFLLLSVYKYITQSEMEC